jgi:hypothetical protein
VDIYSSHTPVYLGRKPDPVASNHHAEPSVEPVECLSTPHILQVREGVRDMEPGWMSPVGTYRICEAGSPPGESLMTGC